MILGQCYALKAASEATNSTTITDDSQGTTLVTVNLISWIAVYNELVKSSACENFS